MPFGQDQEIASTLFIVNQIVSVLFIGIYPSIRELPFKIGERGSGEGGSGKLCK